ncbi:MAG: M13 family metallopeptidase [Acidobacteriota bacterium]
MRILCTFLLFAGTVFSQSTSGISGFSVAALNKTVDPCANFYQFACGGWLTTNPIPGDVSRWGRFDALSERNRALLQNVLETASSPRAGRSTLEQKLGDYYAACMDDSVANIRSMDALQRDLNRIDVVSNQNELTDLMIYTYRMGVFPFFNFSSEQDAKNSSVMIAVLDQGGLGLPDRDYYLKTDAASVELRDKYLAHVAKVFGLLGATPDVAKAKATAVLTIETALAQVALDRVSRRDPEKVYHKMTLAELKTLSPGFDWERFFNGVGVSLTGTNNSLNVAVPDFAAGFSKLLAAQSMENLKAYLTWQLVNDLTPVLSTALRQARFEFFDKTLRGSKEMRARWKQCVDMTDAQLPDALSQKFLERTLGAEGARRTHDMVLALEAALERDINGLDWMTPDTKKAAVAKLHKITNKIGNQEKWQDYANVRIARDDVYGNASRANQYELARQLGKIGKPVDKTEWQMSQPTVNAYYDAQNNDINFPAGILQPPFYDNAMDDAVNFGAIGAVIGHELTHGFDDQGRQFDGDGNLRDWWTEADAKAFGERADCLVQQYSSYSPVADVKLNGKLTLGENTADNGGVRVAFMALMDSLAKKVAAVTNAAAAKSPELIDGFTPEQRFFLGWAQVWCQNITDASAKLRAQTDSHSPGEFRVNGVLSNMPEFQKAYFCKVTQPMVRGPACRVW